MALISSRRGGVDRIQMFLMAAVAGFLIFNSGNIKTSLWGYEPKNIPFVEASRIKTLGSTKPAVVYFYHKPADDTPKKYLPVLDEFVERYGNRLHFYRYRLNENYENEEFKNYWSHQSTLVMFKNGEAVKSWPAMLGDPRFLPRGFVFKFIKDSIVGVNPLARERSDWFLKPEEFESKVLNSKKPVIVNFSCDTCPAARMLEPHYKQIAMENSEIADFHMVDTNDQKNKEIVEKYGARATPTMVLFYNGEKKLRQTGAYSQREPNEALILGMISNYYY